MHSLSHRQTVALLAYLGEKLTEKGWGRGEGQGVNVTLNTLLIDERHRRLCTHKALDRAQAAAAAAPRYGAHSQGVIEKLLA